MPAMPRRFHWCRPAFATLTIWLAAGCADGTPATSDPPVPPPDHVIAALTCAVDVKAASLACGAPPAPSVEGLSTALLGGQGRNVRLASSGVSYDGTSTFSADVTVQNLIQQVLGTRDDRTPAPEGIRIFFHSGPTVTAGSGAVSVVNADGVGAFTGADQPYFQYSEPLATGAVSVPRTWRFNVPNTVQTFEFVVYVAAPVRRESGWIHFGYPWWMRVGNEGLLTAPLRGMTGLPVEADQPVAWSSSNPAVVSVDTDGRVMAVSEGDAVITATSGAKSGKTTLHVLPEPFPTNPFEYSPATIGRMTFLSRFGRANGVDGLEVAILPNSNTWVRAVSMSFRSPSGGQSRSCQAIGGPFTSWHFCHAGILTKDTELGLWQLASVSVDGERYSGAAIEAGGEVTVFQVRDANTAPPQVCETDWLSYLNGPQCPAPGGF